MHDPAESGGDASCVRMQDTVRLTADGLAKVLGDLEARVMRAVWALADPAPARAVHREVIREHVVALHTIITVLNKLVSKELLRREKAADVYHYRAAVTEPEFLAQTSRRVVEGIMSLGPDAVIASFVDVMAEQDPARLKTLMALVQQRIEESEG
jgi:predicted transcriptional regulator